MDAPMRNRAVFFETQTLTFDVSSPTDIEDSALHHSFAWALLLFGDLAEVPLLLLEPPGRGATPAYLAHRVPFLTGAKQSWALMHTRAQSSSAPAVSQGLALPPWGNLQEVPGAREAERWTSSTGASPPGQGWLCYYKEETFVCSTLPPPCVGQPMLD